MFSYNMITVWVEAFLYCVVIVTHVRKCVLAKACEAMFLQQAREGITVYM